MKVVKASGQLQTSGARVISKGPQGLNVIRARGLGKPSFVAVGAVSTVAAAASISPALPSTTGANVLLAFITYLAENTTPPTTATAGWSIVSADLSPSAESTWVFAAAVGAAAPTFAVPAVGGSNVTAFIASYAGSVVAGGAGVLSAGVLGATKQAPSAELYGTLNPLLVEYMVAYSGGTTAMVNTVNVNSPTRRLEAHNVVLGAQFTAYALWDAALAANASSMTGDTFGTYGAGTIWIGQSVIIY